MRRLIGVIAIPMMVIVSFAIPAHAAAATGTTTAKPIVSIIQIGGLLDNVQADFWEHALKSADAEHATALVVQIDSSHSVLSKTRLTHLLSAIHGAATPVAVWVGPARAGHVAGATELTLINADVVGVAPGAHIKKQAGTVVPVQLHSPTLGDFLVDLNGRAGISVPTTVIHVKGSSTPHRTPDVDVQFAKPSLIARAIHGVTSPGPAYALLVLGLLLAVLEFTTAGVGLAAGTAAILLILAALGLGGLPVNGLGVAALIFAVFGFAIDLQAGAPRAWTAIGTGALMFGSLTLYRDGLSVPIVWVIAVFGLTAAFVFAGLPSLIRARFSSPTIGREGFIGELGAAVGTLQPEGLVSVRGATWRARTNRATPINDGEAVRVIGIDGLVLDVEPESGGAKDYRERSKAST